MLHNKKHGLYKTRDYHIWQNAKRRCISENGINVFKHDLQQIVTGMTHSGNETYSSMFFIKITRTSSTGSLGTMRLLSADVHYITDRDGSKTEAHDY